MSAREDSLRECSDRGCSGNHRQESYGQQLFYLRVHIDVDLSRGALTPQEPCAQRVDSGGQLFKASQDSSPTESQVEAASSECLSLTLIAALAAAILLISILRVVIGEQ